MLSCSVSFVHCYWLLPGYTDPLQKYLIQAAISGFQSCVSQDGTTGRHASKKMPQTSKLTLLLEQANTSLSFLFDSESNSARTSNIPLRDLF